VKLQEYLEKIPKLASIIENPELYDEYKKQRRVSKEAIRRFDIARGYSIDRQAVLVWSGGQFVGLETFLASAYKIIPFDTDQAHVVIKETLQDAIDCCVPGDVIILREGCYHLEDVGDLADCLTVFGIGDKSELFFVKKSNKSKKKSNKLLFKLQKKTRWMLRHVPPRSAFLRRKKFSKNIFKKY
jgi:hypothetical protein